ncbi:MAG: hypothetical protein OXU27_18470 [Candidatus Poribacteria bacterium]|nr:hypothetical protein [Candidatus Poribacteria bacterium]
MIETLKSILLRIIGIIFILSYICWGISAAHRFREDGHVEWKYFLFLSPVMLAYAIVYWCIYIVRKVIAASRNKRN